MVDYGIQLYIKELRTQLVHACIEILGDHRHGVVLLEESQFPVSWAAIGRRAKIEALQHERMKTVFSMRAMAQWMDVKRNNTRSGLRFTQESETAEHDTSGDFAGVRLRYLPDGLMHRSDESVCCRRKGTGRHENGAEKHSVGCVHRVLRFGWSRTRGYRLAAANQSPTDGASFRVSLEWNGGEQDVAAISQRGIDEGNSRRRDV